MFVDTHTHVVPFSPDAKMNISELISSAQARNLSVVAITEHYEYDNPDPNDKIQTFDLDAYAETFKDWQKLCPPSLTLLKGVEFGYQTHTAKIIDEIAASSDLDIVLLSNHLFRGVDVYYSKNFDSIPKELRHKEYVAKLAEMVESVNNFDIATHFDYINKFCPDPNANLLYSDCPHEFDRFFEALIAKEKVLELNTASSSRRNAMPDPQIIQRYIDMGGRLFALSSDAHAKEFVGCLIPEFAELLKSFGIHEVCYFQNRQLKLATLPD